MVGVKIGRHEHSNMRPWHETLADFSQYYLFSVPTDRADVSEKLIIRVSCASANTAHAAHRTPNHKKRLRPRKNHDKHTMHLVALLIGDGFLLRTHMNMLKLWPLEPHSTCLFDCCT